MKLPKTTTGKFDEVRYLEETSRARKTLQNIMVETNIDVVALSKNIESIYCNSHDKKSINDLIQSLFHTSLDEMLDEVILSAPSYR